MEAYCRCGHTKDTHNSPDGDCWDCYCLGYEPNEELV